MPSAPGGILLQPELVTVTEHLVAYFPGIPEQVIGAIREHEQLRPDMLLGDDQAATHSQVIRPATRLAAVKMSITVGAARQFQ